MNTDFEISGKKTSAEDLGFNTDINKAQEVTKDEEKHLDAELHTDLLGKDKQEELKKGKEIIKDIVKSIGNSKDTLGGYLERYKQLSVVSGIADQFNKNPELYSILGRKALNEDGTVNDKVLRELAGVYDKVINGMLRDKGYKGQAIKIVLTDVADKTRPFYTDTTTGVMVFDRESLARADRKSLINYIGHEVGHFSSLDNGIKNDQIIANYTGEQLEKKTENLSFKNPSKETIEDLGNSDNVITGEFGKWIADNIPMDRREYYTLEYFGTGGVASKKNCFWWKSFIN